MNKALIIGNAGRDPEIRKGKSDSSICRFSVATSMRYKDKDGEKVEKTTWHNCVAFGKTADVIAQYVQKGSKVAIEGRIENTSSTNDAGEKKFYSNIVVEQIEFLSKPRERSDDDDDPPTDKKFDPTSEFEDDDIPF